MKTIVCLLLLTLFSNALLPNSGQFVLPAAGNEFTVHKFILDSIDFNPGFAGTDQDWQMYGITSVSEFTVSVSDAGQSIYSTNFINADIVVENEYAGVSEFANTQTHLQFYRKYRGSLIALGRVDIDTSIGLEYFTYYNDPETKSEELMYYGYYWSDTWSGSYFDHQLSANVYLDYGFTSCTVDGAGELRYKGVVLKNVLRIKRERLYVEIAPLTSPVAIKETSYEWWSNGVPFPVFTLVHKTSSAPGYKDQYSGYYMDQSSFQPIGMKNHEDILMKMEVYPNPANNLVHLSFDLEERSFVSVAICDAGGRKLATLHESMQERGRQQISNSLDLTPGFYLIVAEVGGEVITRPLAIN